MTDTPFLDHRAIKRLADETPKLAEILVQREIFDAIEPVTPAVVGEGAAHEAMGYFATSDGRIVLRLVCQQEAQEIFGVDAASTKEAFLLADRLANIGQIEQAAIDAQARAVKLFRACETLFAAQASGQPLGKKDAVRIGALLHETRKEDEAKAERIAELKAEQEQLNRDRKWAMRKLGVL